MAAHALHFPPAASHLRLVSSRPAAVWPAPPPLPAPEPALSLSMKRCLLLALLLHVWLVLMLGSAPGGTAAPGQGVAGTLNITLQGPETPGATEEMAPALPAPVEGAPGSATLPRWGGVVREQAVAPPTTPGAAQLGRWSATRQPADLPAVPPPPPGRVVEERAEAVRAQAADAQPLNAQPANARPADARPVNSQPVQTQPVREPVLQTLAPTVLPALPALAAEAAVPALAALAEPLAAPAALPSAPPAPSAPSVVPASPVSPVSPAPGPASERALATPIARALPDIGAAMPIAPSASPLANLPTVQALPRPQAIAPRLLAPARPALPELPALAAAEAVVATSPASVPPLAPTPEPIIAPLPTGAPGLAPSSAPSTPITSSTPTLPPPGFNPGAPDAGSRAGSDVATPPAAAASAPPRLNLQLSRPRGGELSRGGSAGALAVLPRPPEIDEKLGRDIAKAARQDCKDAYRGAGLLALVPLAAQALEAGSGCKW